MDEEPNLLEPNDAVDDSQLKRPNNLRLVVRKYFIDILKDDGENIEARCSLCKPKNNIIRGQYRAPSNFTKHIKVWFWFVFL